MLSASLISAVLANKLPGAGSVYLGQTLRFVAPVFPGDEITARVTVKEIRDDKPVVKLETVCLNQRDEIVIRGEATVLATDKRKSTRTRISFAPTGGTRSRC